MSARRKVSASFANLEMELNRLVNLDAQNQARYRAGPGRPTASILTSTQLHTITEGVFNRAFRSFETFVEEVFVLYVMGKGSRSGRCSTSYLLPKSSEHAIELMQSGMTFLEWNNPEFVIRRAELYLKDGYPVKEGITNNLVILREARLVRNHIAHNSRQSQIKFNNVIRAAVGTLPVRVPSPGEFLQMSDRRNPGRHLLLLYLDGMKKVANDLTA